MENEITRIVEYSAEFYFKKILIIALFSLPFFIAALVPLLVPAPTYLAAGALFVRTGSLPEFAPLDLLLTLVAYAIVMFLISDTIVNINIIVRSKRTLTEETKDMVASMQTHAWRIFLFLTGFVFVLLALQLLTFESPLQTWIYPVAMLLLSFFLFFVPPAIVIDNVGIWEAMLNSARLSTQKPMMIVVWFFVAAVPLVIAKLVADLLFAGIFAQYFVLLLNSIVLLPFLIILQTQMYMEKYPLAK